MSELIFEVTQEADGGFCADCLTESMNPGISASRYRTTRYFASALQAASSAQFRSAKNVDRDALLKSFR
jgi:hypothetical protein